MPGACSPPTPRCRCYSPSKATSRAAREKPAGKDLPNIRRYDQHMQERRTEIRMLCADVVETCWTDRDGETQRASALLEDISPSGACLQLEMAVPLGVSL